MASVTATYRPAFRRGDRFDFSIRYLADGTPVNLTGFSAEMIITWPAWRSSTRIIDAGSVLMTTGTGEITLGGALGTIDAHLDADETDAVPFAGPPVAWQMRIYSTALNKETVLSGELLVLNNLFEVSA